VTSEQLANYVEEFIRDAQARVKGTGDEQYSEGDQQKFETMPLPELFRWADEELQDIAVYAAMLSLRLQRLKLSVARQWDGPHSEVGS
jgi:hypothetical protein